MHLHTVKNSPLTDATLAQCLSYLGDKAGLLLMQDAVVAATDGHPWQQKLATLGTEHPVYVLADDLAARGLADRVSSQFQVIDYPRFINLCLEFDTVQSW